jgi:ligand-binding sensor domain-containing protein/DNA-binding CsgD family transcriptional regulator
VRKAIVFILLSFLPLHAQELLPFTENFTKAEYNGDNQVWNLAQGSDNAMYFANNHYLLRYNGVVWEKYSLPNKTIIRSIFVDADRVYCGSYKEFGYWQRVAGRMKYFSLSGGKRLFEGISDNEEIWKVFAYKGEIYFQSFNELFILGNGKIRKLRLPSQISYCYVINGEVYAASVRDGILRMDQNKFVPVISPDALKNNVIHHIEQIGNTLYAFTKNNGIFIHDAQGVKPWNHPLNDVLKDQVIITGKFIGNDKMAIGTALSGLYIVNLGDGSWQNINRQNAIKNNAVLSIATDKENDLWLGLDNGIAHVEINSPVTVFLDNSGILGSVYALSPFETGYLLATNHGLFKSLDGKITVVPDSQGQVWDIFRNGNQFIIGHNDGTYNFDGQTFKNANPVNGGWQFIESQFDSVYFQANYSGIAVYADKSDLSKYKTLSGLTKPIRKISQDMPGELWAADNYRSLYRICYDKDFTTTKIENVSQNSGIANDYGVKIFGWKGKSLFLIANRWYVYDRHAGKLVVEKSFNRLFANISDIIPVNGNNFMVVKNGLLYLITESRGAFIWRLIPEKYYQGKLIFENIKVSVDGNRLLVNLDDGFLSLQLNKSDLTIPKVKIEAFRGYDLINSEVKIKYNEPITIHAVPDYYGFGRPDLLYRRNDEGAFIRLKSGSVTLSNLDSGAQEVAVYFNDGHKLVKIAQYRFKVGYPWYFSFGMIVLYVLVIALICLLYYRWNNLRYKQKLALREEEMRHQRDLMAMENELRIQEYEKHILELEIQSKSTEVAGKSFSIAKQGEVMDNIRKILDNESDVNKLKTGIKRAIRTNTIEKHEWEAFETNMKQIHSEFVTRLLARHPDLSAKDIRLAIYLRMNLSSKEIAPLMNISFRGVELHRYRLRRKLELAQEVGLSKYMTDI